MTTRGLARRLERLEAEIMPGEEEIVVLHIHGVSPNGQVVEHLQFTVHIPPPPMKRRLG